MCNECFEIDKKIAKFREIVGSGFDVLTTDRLKEAIAEMEQRKVWLHQWPTSTVQQRRIAVLAGQTFLQ